jgi:Glycosyltransferase family 87
MGNGDGLRWDVATYVAGSVLAGLAAVTDRIPLQRTWGAIALPSYLVATVLGGLLLIGRGRLSQRTVVRSRVWLAVAVLAGAALLPMGLEVSWRAREGFRDHVQSEVLVTEGSAEALASGANPYKASFARGPLGSWPRGTADHVPYLPGMFAFGLPRALVGPATWTDARVVFTSFSLWVLLAAFWLARPMPSSGLTAMVVIVASPLGARYLTGGGDDVAVLSLMLLALVLLRGSRPTAAGVTAGLAAAMKLTAWPLLPLLVVAARDREGHRASGRALASAATVLVVLVLPVMVWSPGAFVEDVLLFPFGLSHTATLAASPTLGSLLAAALPLPKAAIAGTSLLLAGLLTVYLAAVKPPRDARGAAERTALVMAVAISLATAGRFGYFIYPIGLLAWARLVLAEGRSAGDVDGVARTHTLRWEASREGARAAKGSGL